MVEVKVEDDREFGIPFKIKWTPFKRCDECNKRKLNTSFYEVHDTGLNAHIDYWVCKKCMKEAEERAKKERKKKK